jgi:hypothetical protein
MSTLVAGRAALTAWRAAQPADLFADDAAFAALIEHHGLQSWSARWGETGRMVATALDPLVCENNLHRNLPVLDDYDAVGNFTARVSHHPTHAAAGRLMYGTGLLTAYGLDPAPHRFILGTFYLTAQAGEAGHNCPFACDAGAICKVCNTHDASRRPRHDVRPDRAGSTPAPRAAAADPTRRPGHHCCGQRGAPPCPCRHERLGRAAVGTEAHCRRSPLVACNHSP